MARNGNSNVFSLCCQWKNQSLRRNLVKQMFSMKFQSALEQHFQTKNASFLTELEIQSYK